MVVGAGFGGELKRIASVLAKGTTIVAVENPKKDVPEYLNLVASLKETCRQLCSLGATVELLLGDPESPKVVSAVEGYAPYDFVFVNGSAKDAENYGPMARVMGFVNGSKVEITYRE